MKKNYLLGAIFFSALLFSGILHSQTTTIDFETENSGYTASSTSGSGFTDVFNRYDGSSHSGGAIGGNSTFVWAVEDLAITNPSITLDQIDVTGSASFTFSIDMLAHHFQDWDSTDELLITYSLDGGTAQNLMWVQMHTGSGDASNGPAALDLSFDGDGDCGSGTTLPALTTGSIHGCTVSSSTFETFTTASIPLSSNTTLDITLQFNSLTATDEGIYIDNIVITETAASSDPTVTFDSSSSSETETDATFATSGIPITLTNYDADVTITPSVNGSSTAEAGDYTLDLTPLVFDANETLSIPLSINPDAGFDNETLVIDIAVTSGTATLGTSQHTVTITDDETPNIAINEILYDPATSVADGDSNGDGSRDASDDEFIEIVNLETSSADISSFTLEDSSGTVHTFAASTTLPAGGSIVVFGGGTPTSIPGLSVTASTGSVSLSNSGETVTLKNASGTTLDSHTYTSGDGNDQSVARNIDLTGSFTGHNSINSNPVNFSPGRFNASNISFEVNTWKGTTDNDWDTGSNWSTGSAPGGSDDVQILAGITNYPTASGAVTVNSVTINSGATLIAQSTFSGSVTYNRYLGTTNWYLVAAPVNGQTIVDFYTNESPALGSGTGDAQNVAIAPYDNSQTDSNDRWVYYTEGQVDGADGDDTTDTFTSAIGYSVKMQSVGDIAFTGTMNVSDFSSLSLTDNSGASGTAFNLMGNPYTSFVAADNTANATNNILSVNTSLLSEETIWIWDESANAGAGGYTQYNNTSGFHIAPGQGFFVSADGNASTFSITEAMQSHQSTDTFQRTNNNRPEINLEMTDGTNVKDVDIFYIDGMTTGFDNGYDSSIFGGLSTSFAIYTQAVANGEGRNLGIQSLPNNGDFENMVIPVGIKASSGDEITISATSLNLPTDINVYLEDKSDNSFTILDSSSSFVTTLTENLDGIGRFYLHTKTQVLSVDDLDLNNISIYKSDENNIRIVGVQNGNAQVSLYNILGKQVLYTSFEGNGVNDVTLPSLRTGVYIIQLETETGKLNKKIIIE
jgi:hypothetical protein